MMEFKEIIVLFLRDDNTMIVGLIALFIVLLFTYNVLKRFFGIFNFSKTKIKKIYVDEFGEEIKK